MKNMLKPGELIDAMAAELAEVEFADVLRADAERLEFPVTAPSGAWRVSVIAAAEPLVVVSQHHLPVHLPEHRRGEGALLADALSAKLSVGDFRVDADDGTLMLQIVIPVLSHPDEAAIKKIFLELIHRPVVAFHQAFFPLVQFACGLLEKDTCIQAVVGGKGEPQTWEHREIEPRWN